MNGRAKRQRDVPQLPAPSRSITSPMAASQGAGGDQLLGSQVVNVNGNGYVTAGPAHHRGAELRHRAGGPSVSQVSRSPTAPPARRFRGRPQRRFGATSGTGANLISGSGALPTSAGRGHERQRHNGQRQHSPAGLVNGAIAVNYAAPARQQRGQRTGRTRCRFVDLRRAGTIQANVINQARRWSTTPHQPGERAGGWDVADGIREYHQRGQCARRRRH